MSDFDEISKKAGEIILESISEGYSPSITTETVPSFAKLKADGPTSAGNWLMTGSFDQKDENKMMKRDKEDSTAALVSIPIGPLPGRSTGVLFTAMPPAT